MEQRGIWTTVAQVKTADLEQLIRILRACDLASGTKVTVNHEFLRQEWRWITNFWDKWQWIITFWNKCDSESRTCGTSDNESWTSGTSVIVNHELVGQVTMNHELLGQVWWWLTNFWDKCDSESRTSGTRVIMNSESWTSKIRMTMLRLRMCRAIPPLSHTSSWGGV